MLTGGPGTGKTQLATTIGVEALCTHAKRVRFFSTVELVNALRLEKAIGRAGQVANRILHVDLVILGEVGYLPFSQAGSALSFHLLSILKKRTSVMITTNLSYRDWGSAFADAKMITAQLDRLTHYCHIVETCNEFWRFRNRSMQQGQKRRSNFKPKGAKTTQTTTCTQRSSRIMRQ